MGEDSKDQGGKQSEAEGSRAAQPTKSPWAGMLSDAVGRLMPIFLTGASLVGFIAFAGAVIVWTRFFAIEVPPEQAVKAVPRSELVATGASVLLIFGFFGVLAIVATYLVDRSGRATPGMSRALIVLLVVEGCTAIRIFDDKWDQNTTLAVAIFAAAALVAFLATFHEALARYVDELESRSNETLEPCRGPGPFRDEEGKARASYAEFLSLKPWRPVKKVYSSLRTELKDRRAREKEDRDRREAERRKREQVRRERLEGEEELEREWEESRLQAEREIRMGRRRPHRLKITPLGVVVLGGLGAFAIIAPCWILNRQGWLAVPLGAAMILGIGVWRIAVLSKPAFMWFGFAIFISVPLFGTLALMARNVSDPQVQPMALIRSTDDPGEAIQGIYVTEGSDRIYFASVATEGCKDKLKGDSGRLLWVPKDEVVAMSVGPLQDVKSAGLAALEMAYALTPDVETPTGERVELGGAQPPPGTEAEVSTAAGEVALDVTSEEAEAEASADDKANEGDATQPQAKEPSGEDEEAEVAASPHRLENAGPAVRPDFGTGLRLVPSSAEPGDVVELRMSVPNTDVDGFGQTPAGYNLRLNGVRLAVLRIPALDSDQAEYVKTARGKVLALDWYSEKKATQGEWVRLKSDAAIEVTGDDAEHPLGLKVDEEGKLLPEEDEATGEEVSPWLPSRMVKSKN